MDPRPDLNTHSTEPSSERRPLSLREHVDAEDELLEKPSPEFIAEEKKRRERNKELAQACREMDQELFHILARRNPQSAIDLMKRIELLRDSEIQTDQVQEVTEGKGLNETSRVTFGTTDAFVKSQISTASYSYDDVRDCAVIRRRTWDEMTQAYHVTEKPMTVRVPKMIRDPKTGEERPETSLNPATGKLETVYIDVIDTDAREALKNFIVNEQTYRKRIAAYYGISPEEVPFTVEEMTPRFAGIDAHTSVAREFSASHLDALLGFGSIPLTIARRERAGTNILSVQEGISGSPMTYEQYQELVKTGPRHPMAKSIMRLACMDYLIKSADHTPLNVLVDEELNHAGGIDNELSQGFSMEKPKRQKTQTAKERAEAVTHYRTSVLPLQSVAYEIVYSWNEAHKEPWVLDDEVRSSLRTLYEDSIAHLKFREQRAARTQKHDLDALDEPFADELDDELELHPDNAKGDALRLITKMYRQIFQNERIAKKEAIDFLQKLKYLIDNGRPPQLEKGVTFVAFGEDKERFAAPKERRQAA